MNRLSYILLILCLASCEIEEKQRSQKIIPISAPDTSWVKHIVPLRKDIGVMTIYLPKTYDAFQFEDTAATSDAADECYRDNVYQFRPHRFASYGMHIGFLGEPLPDSTQLVTIRHRTYSFCDVQFTNMLSFIAYHRITTYNAETKLNQTTSTYLHHDSMVISDYPYYLIKSEFLYARTNTYYCDLSASILIPAGEVRVQGMCISSKRIDNVYAEWQKIIACITIE